MPAATAARGFERACAAAGGGRRQRTRLLPADLDRHDIGRNDDVDRNDIDHACSRARTRGASHVTVRDDDDRIGPRAGTAKR
jgi:hypothetical protein